jgi:hypothetical protein
MRAHVELAQLERPLASRRRAPAFPARTPLGANSELSEARNALAASCGDTKLDTKVMHKYTYMHICKCMCMCMHM